MYEPPNTSVHTYILTMYVAIRMHHQYIFMCMYLHLQGIQIFFLRSRRLPIYIFTRLFVSVEEANPGFADDEVPTLN